MADRGLGDAQAVGGVPKAPLDRGGMEGAKGGKGVFGSAKAWEVSRRHDFLSSHESYFAASSRSWR